MFGLAFHVFFNLALALHGIHHGAPLHVLDCPLGGMG